MEDPFDRTTEIVSTMRYTTGIAALITGCFLATACAAQTSTVVPDGVPTDKVSSFEKVAKKIDNPCAEPELESYETLDDLVKAGKVCRESWLLSETITFFLNANAPEGDVISVVRKEALNMATPVSFALEGRPKKGSDTAPIKVVIFSDFQCPYCAQGKNTLERVAKDYGEDVQIVFKHYPLINIHPEALPAAMCSVYANTQGKFWEVHDKLFTHQKELSLGFIQKVVEEDLGTTLEEVYSPDKGHVYSDVIVADMADADAANVRGTPTVFVDGVLLEAGQSYLRLASRIEAVKKAPAAASEALRAKKRAKVLSKCPYDASDVQNIYELLTPSGKSETISLASDIPCPCPDSRGSLHECVNNEGVCVAAPEILKRIMQRINEGVAKDKMMDEIQSLFVKARVGR